MPDKVKVGFVGAGTVGQMHIGHWSQIPACDARALAELRPYLRDLVAKRFAIPHSYETHFDLIKDQEIEAVVVVTRRHNTAAVVEGCLKAGKHVFSEKPMAKTAEQANSLAQIAKSLGLIYAVGYQRRHDHGTQIAKNKFDQLLKTKQLGKIVFVRCWNFTGQDRKPHNDCLMTTEPRSEGLRLSQVPQWLPAEFESAYDRFINVCCHDVNIQRYFFGKRPTVKFANLDHKQGLVVIFDFNDFLSDFNGSINELNDGGIPAEWDEGMEIIFEKGRLSIKFSPPLVHHLCTRVELELIDGTKEILCTGKDSIPAFSLQAENFLHSILGRENPLASGSDAVEDIQIIEEIWQKYFTSKNLSI